MTFIFQSNVVEAITCDVKPGNAFEGGVTEGAFWHLGVARR
jgi:hypothetical protein